MPMVEVTNMNTAANRAAQITYRPNQRLWARLMTSRLGVDSFPYSTTSTGAAAATAAATVSTASKRPDPKNAVA